MSLILTPTSFWTKLDQRRLEITQRTFGLCNNWGTHMDTCTNAHNRCRIRTGFECILSAVLHRQTVDRKLWLFCKCGTKASTGGSSDHQLFSTTRQGQSVGVSRNDRWNSRLHLGALVHSLWTPGQCPEKEYCSSKYCLKLWLLTLRSYENLCLLVLL